MDTQLVNVIFGVKIRQARTQAGLTLSEFAQRCDISPSYATEVEKGRKYPRIDKIMRMADVLDKSYDDLVSIALEPPLKNLESALASPLLSHFPFDEFGLETSDLVGLLTKAPDKASALLNTLLEVGRQYDLREEQFLLAALRSYQELHDNFFPELEEAVADFAGAHNLWENKQVRGSVLEEILRTRFNYTMDDQALAAQPDLARYRSVYLDGKQAKLLVNPRLRPKQRKFLLAREIGYQVLGMDERSATSPPEVVYSFPQALNDFKAAYFGGALLMAQAPMLADLHAFFGEPLWQPQRLLNMLAEFDVTPEMLLYRISELAPRFFGLRQHFLRVQQRDGVYKVVKRLHMNRLLMPSGLSLDEHYCRRWLVVRLLRELEEQQATAEAPARQTAPQAVQLHVGVQISEFLVPRDRFLCFGFARPLVLAPETISSATLGFQMDDAARETIRFLADPAVPNVTINETCERCPLLPEQCHERAAPPLIYQRKQQAARRRELLRELRQSYP